MEQDREGLERRKIEAYAEVEGKRVLEVGCGDGRVTAWLAGKPGKYVAIDPDKTRLAQAKAHILHVDFRVGSGETLEFADQSFDVVLFTLSLHHQNSAKALREAYRVLRPGGRAGVIEPAVNGEVQQFFNLFHDETEALERALEAIRGSAFGLEKKENFFVDWVFADKEEVYAYDFSRQGAKPDAHLIARINATLGHKLHDRPIRLQDKLTIFALRKE